MTNSEKMVKGCSLFAEGFIGATTDTMNLLSDMIELLKNSISGVVYKFVVNKKITKKKFKKLLQSKGTQRNEINRLLQDNKEPYTMARLIKIVKERG